MKFAILNITTIKCESEILDVNVRVVNVFIEKLKYDVDKQKIKCQNRIKQSFVQVRHRKSTAVSFQNE